MVRNRYRPKIPQAEKTIREFENRRTIMHRNMKKILAAVLIGVLTLGTAGCANIQTMIETALTAQGSTKNWYYSDIEGQLTADMTIRKQDDFHAAVNKDWILSQKTGEDGFVIDLLSGEKEMERQMRVLLRDPDSTGYLSNTTVGMSAEEIAHAGKLVAAFAEEAGNEEKRTALGAEPLRPYVEAVTKIRSLSEMTEFITKSDRNILGSPLIDITVGATKTDPGTYRLLTGPMNEGYLTLDTPASYQWIDVDAIFSKQKKSEITRLVLGKLGFQAGEIRGILSRCYRLECRLAEHMQRPVVLEADDYEEKYAREMPIDEADALFGDYPFAAFLRANGLDQNGLVTIYQPEYMEALSAIYCEENLEELKAFYLVNTIYAGCDLLDPGTAEAVNRILTRGGEEAADSSKDGSSPDSAAPMDLGDGAGLSAEDKKTDAIINNYIRQYLGAPFDMMYIAAYLNGGEKDALRDLTHTVKKEFRNILAAEEWMSEESRAHCVEKLDAMAERILFPDEYISCLPLEFTGDENLVDMVQSIFSYNRSRRASLIGKERTRNEWDLFECPTTVANAFNAITENAIILPAGITAGKFTFDMAAPYEQNLARMGTILGHEITHGFDDTGTKYDRYGAKYSYDHIDDLMTADDRSEFTSRTYRLAAWYAAQSPVPGQASYTAAISGEAIADMGGMKCALAAAEHKEDFDYDLFFRSYAELWRKVCTEETERLYAMMDPHPLAFFRTNVTLGQFDRFGQTYGVKEGDGMYLAPENRIIIW